MWCICEVRNIQGSLGEVETNIEMQRNTNLANLWMRIEPYLHNTEQYFIFLMLGDPSGTPVSREKEVGVQVTSIPDFHNQCGASRLACMRLPPKRLTMVHLGSKIEVLRGWIYLIFHGEMFWCFEWVSKEHRSTIETIGDNRLERDKISTDEIWDILRKAPRIPHPLVKPADEQGALAIVKRWSIYGMSLPTRVTFGPRMWVFLHMVLHVHNRQRSLAMTHGESIWPYLFIFLGLELL